MVLSDELGAWFKIIMRLKSLQILSDNPKTYGTGFYQNRNDKNVIRLY